jgi:hypothetical protein
VQQFHLVALRAIYDSIKMTIENTETHKVEAEGHEPLLFQTISGAIAAFDEWRTKGKKRVRRSVLSGTQWECVEFTVS